MRYSKCVYTMEYNNKIYQYKIKIISGGGGIGIGIDEDGYKLLNSWFYGTVKTRHYGFSDCQIYSFDITPDEDSTPGQRKYGKEYTEPGMIIKMIYNAAKSTLSYSLNDEDLAIAVSDVYKQEGLDYRLCIYLYSSSNPASIQLIDYEITEQIID